MQGTIEELQDTFKIGYEQFEASYLEAKTVNDMFHNRQYTSAQLTVLENRGQPAETFNVVKLFARMLLGYYSSVVNDIQALPVDVPDIATSSVLNDAIQFTLRDNQFDSEADKIKLQALLAGVFCVYLQAKQTSRKDEFGRYINRIELSYVPINQLVMDPTSEKEDYSDAEWIHRFKWISRERVVRAFGAAKADALDEYHNHLDTDISEFTYDYDKEFQGIYKLYDMYLIVHSVVKDLDNKVLKSIFWSGDEILKERDITAKVFEDSVWPYRIHKLHTSDQPEFYGIFREVIESQKAINQALLKLQLMSNTEKVLVEENALPDKDLDAFANAYNRVSGIIKVLSLKGIKIENLTREVLDQYTLIDKAFDRIQRVLSVNDSFLGMAFASDSGRKVKLQQNASVVALRYLTTRLEQFYRLLGLDIAKLIKRTFTAHQFLRMTDDHSKYRWTELNRPAQVNGGLVFAEVLDESGEPKKDEYGSYLLSPLPDPATELTYTNVDIEVASVAYNDEDEKNQLMLETTLSGSIGNMLAQVNPAGYFKAAALSMKTMKTKHSPEIASILEETAAMLQGDQQQQMQASQMAGDQQQARSPLSATQKLPQNTNEI